MGETCQICGLELASVETRNLLHAGELVRYGEYRGKCVRDASCLQRGYEREKARAEKAINERDMFQLCVKNEKENAAKEREGRDAEWRAVVKADREALAAARRECEGLRRALSDACAALALAGQELVRRLNERREKMSTVDVVNDEVAEAVARAVNAARIALAAPAAGGEGER